MIKGMVSVIIPVYNDADYVGRAIDSVLSQTYTAIEILVVNDGSNDDGKTEQALAAYQDRATIITGEHVGAAHARNLGIGKAVGEYLAFLDSDDYFYPQKIEIQHYMIKNNLAFSSTSYDRWDISKNYTEFRSTAREYGKRFPGIIQGCTIATPTVMVRADVMRELRFPERFHIGEDICLWIDIAYQYELGHIDLPLTCVCTDGENTAAYNSVSQLIGLTNILLFVTSNASYRCEVEAVNALIKSVQHVYCLCNASEDIAKNELVEDIPLVSIVIPVYNGADYLRCAIDSALSQTYANCEVIVVNDGSDDGGETDAIACSYGDRIRYFRKENGGVATALNMGIENMRGEYFSWLSHDDYYLPDKVKNQMDCLRGVTPDTIIYGGYTLLHIDTGFLTPVRFYPRYSMEELSTPLFPVFCGLTCGCAMLVHKSHFNRVGLFNPARRTTQDYELWCRMLRDAQIRYCDTCDVVLRQHPNQGSKTIAGNLAECNELWIWMDQQIKDYERAQIAGTPELFYRFVYERIYAAYPEAAKYYYQHAHTEAFRWNRENMSDEDRLTATLIGHYGKLSASNKDMQTKLQMDADALTEQNVTSLSKRLGRALYYHGFRGTVQTLMRRAFGK